MSSIFKKDWDRKPDRFTGLNSSNPLIKYLEAYFPVLESGGLRDYSGHNRHGVKVGSPTNAISAELGGRAIDFGSYTNSWYYYADVPSLATFTACAWLTVDVDASTPSSAQVAVSLGETGSGINVRATLASDNDPDEWGIWDNANSWLRSSITRQVGEKVFVCMVYSGTAYRKIYHNGVLVGTETGLSSLSTNRTRMFIGIEDVDVAEAFDGHQHNIQLYSKALSDNEIKSLYDNPYQLLKPRNIYFEETADTRAISLVKKDWTKKPSRTNIEINLKFNVKAAWIFNEGSGNPRNLSSGEVGTISGAVWSLSEDGQCLELDTASDSIELAAESQDVLTTGDCTILIGYEKTDANNRTSYSFGIDSTTGVYKCSCHLPWSDGTLYWDYGGQAGNNRLAISGLTFGNDNWAFYGGSKGLEVHQNGVSVGSNSAAISRTQASSIGFLLGASAGADADFAKVKYLYIFHEKLNETLIKEINDNPYKILQPRNTYFEGADEGGASVAPPIGLLALLGYAPTITASNPQTINVPAASLTLTGYAPTVSANGNVSIDVPLASLDLTGITPTVNISGNQSVSVPLGSLALAAFAPDIQTPVSVDIPVASLSLAGYTPTIGTGVSVDVPNATLTLTGLVPTISAAASANIDVPVATLTLQGYAPTIDGSISWTVQSGNSATWTATTDTTTTWS